MARLYPFFRPLRNAEIEAIAAEIATCLRDAANSRVNEQADTMSAAEARGYIQARVASVVRTEVNRVAQGNARIQSSQQPRLANLAISFLVERVVVDRRIRRQPGSTRQAA